MATNWQCICTALPQRSAATAPLSDAANSLSPGALPQIPLRELTEIPGPLTVFKGPTSEEREGNGRGGEKGGEGMVKEREGEDRRWREELGPPKNVGVAIPVLVHDANMVCRQRV